MAGFVPFSEQKALHTDAPYRSALLTQPANFRKALAEAQADASKTLVGVANGIPSIFIIKLIAQRKPDFIWIDAEHAMYNRLELHDYTLISLGAIHAAQYHSEGRSMVAVRVSKHDEVSLTTALDAGAAAIVIPHTESAAEVEAFKKEVFFGKHIPWNFTPGLAPSLYPNDPYNIQTANNHICLIPQVESVKGLANVEEIAAVPGISAIMFGPGDYMIDAGIAIGAFMDNKPDPRFFEAMGKFNAAAAKNNLPIFGGALSLEQLPMLIQSGMRAICVQFDVWAFSNMTEKTMNDAKAIVKQFEGNPKASVPEANGKPE
ncbi:hypothetical protein ACEQ8H_004044 [Pleosporales sp. CAS-2024a]